MEASGSLLAEVAEPAFGGLGNPVGIPQRGIPPALDVEEHTAHAVLEAHDRLPSQPRDDLGNIREGAIGLARPFGHVHDVAAEKLDQPVDRLRIASPDVEALAADRGSGSSEKG